MTPPPATVTRPSPDPVTADAESSAPGLVSATWGGDVQSRKEQVALALFIGVPFLAVAAAIPVAWGGWLG
ncbi:MAG: acyl-CoA desaturase, partial [Nocardioidaceae bacterium]